MVPITDFEKFSLFKHDSLPFVMDGRLVKGKEENNLVAVSLNKDAYWVCVSLPLSWGEDFCFLSVLFM